jgi:hypothetical protein
MRRSIALPLIIFLGLWILAINPISVYAQDPEPTATATETLVPTATVTPTPMFEVPVTLTSGNQMVVERKISYGEIAITLALLANLAVILIYLFVRVPRLWIN